MRSPQYTVPPLTRGYDPSRSTDTRIRRQQLGLGLGSAVSGWFLAENLWHILWLILVCGSFCGSFSNPNGCCSFCGSFSFVAHFVAHFCGSFCGSCLRLILWLILWLIFTIVAHLTAAGSRWVGVRVSPGFGSGRLHAGLPPRTTPNDRDGVA